MSALRNIPGTGRIRRLFGGVIFGLFLIPAGIYALFWNEGRTVKYKRALKEGKNQVISSDAENINSDNEGKLIHFTGMAVTEDSIEDPIFGLKQNALSMHRSVELYQWKERKNNRDSVKIRYEKVWSDKIINSEKFENFENHKNPSAMPFSAEDIYAANVTVGNFRLPRELIKKIKSRKSVNHLKTDTSLFPNMQLSTELIYIGYGSLEEPKIGDVKITITKTIPQEVSVIGKQIGSTVEPYTAHSGKEVFLLSEGILSADTMFTRELKRNKVMGWMFRFFGWLIISFGFGALFSPLSRLTGWIPLIGGLVRKAKSLAAMLLSSIISLVVIALSWIYFRPVLGISLLAIAVLLIYYLARKNRKAQIEIMSEQENNTSSPNQKSN